MSWLKPKPQQVIEIDWKDADKDESLWDAQGVLYAYLHPRPTTKILYIGKADGKTVGERFNADDKHPLWDAIEKEFGIEETDIRIIVGTIRLPVGTHMSSELLADLESLLIKAEYEAHNLWWNKQAIETRTSRPGLLVKCTGDWPGEYSEYEDSGG